MSGWQGAPTEGPRFDVSERFVTRGALIRALRTFLADGTTGNHEALRSALNDYDLALGRDDG